MDTATTGQVADRARTAEREVHDAVQRGPTPARILLNSLGDFGAHADGVHAGAMAFFGILSLFPLVLLTIAIASRVLPSPLVTKLVFSQLGALLPDAGPVAGATNSTLHVQAGVVHLGLSALGLLWASLGVFLTVGYAVDRAWAVQGDRNIVVQYLVSAGLSIVVGAFIVAASAISDTAGSVSGNGTVALVAEAVVIYGALVVLYRLLPNCDVSWRDCLLPAALVTSVGGVARAGFIWYMGSIAHVGRLYGPLAGVAGLMLWLFVTSAILLWGAELSHQLADAGQRHRHQPALPSEVRQPTARWGQAA